MNNDKSCIIVFVKAPIQGHVKTRLARYIHEADVVNLYKNFVIDILDKITDAGHALKIFYDPPGSDSLMRTWLGDRQAFFLQNGSDLGQKMANAFSRVFESGIKQAVLIGTDFPDLPGKILTDAIRSLEKHNAVIGPAVDGGYYLIGFSSDAYLPMVFKNISWGTSAVYQQTMNIFASSGATVHQLQKWRDIDDYDDLLNLTQSLTKDPSQAINTYSFLKHIGMIKE